MRINYVFESMLGVQVFKSFVNLFYTQHNILCRCRVKTGAANEIKFSESGVGGILARNH